MGFAFAVPPAVAIGVSIALAGCGGGGTTTIPEDCPAICSDKYQCRVGADYAAIYHMQDSERVCYHGCSIDGWCGGSPEYFAGGTSCCGCAPLGTDFSLANGYDGSCSDDTTSAPPPAPTPEPTPEDCPAICFNHQCQVGGDYAAIYHMRDSQRLCYHGCSMYGWCGGSPEYFAGGTSCCGCAPPGTDFSLANGYDGSCSDDTTSAPPPAPTPEPTPEDCPAICSDKYQCRVGADYAAINHMQDSERVCYHGCSTYGWCGGSPEYFAAGAICCGCAPPGTDFSLAHGYDGSCSDVKVVGTAAVFV